MGVAGSILLPIMRECNNFFDVCSESGDFELNDGKIALKNIYRVNQYIALTGSLLVDGIYQIIARHEGIYTLTGADENERWNGLIFGLNIPGDFIRLCEDIDKFNKSKAGQLTGYTSENVLGAHSWSRATNKNGLPVQWQDVFQIRLRPFNRIFSSIRI